MIAVNASEPGGATGAVTLVRLYVSRGHNFVGHHGKLPGEHPMLELDKVECVAGRGLRGDRYFDFKDNYKGQITFLAFETYEALCQALGTRDRAPSVFRRNVITTGVDLNALVGCQFRIQGVAFRGTEECHPCRWMDQAFGPGAFELLKARGGLRALILSDGVLARDVEHVASQSPEIEEHPCVAPAPASAAGQP